MSKEVVEVTVNSETHYLFIEYKRIKNIIFKYDKDNNFFVSAPYGSTPSKIHEAFFELYPRLLKLKDKPSIPFNEFTYVFGIKHSINTLKEEFTLAKIPLNIEEFYKLIHKDFLNYLKERVSHFETVMKIKQPYNVKLKLMKTRWGSNSKQTHTLNLNYRLIHFSKEIIDALLVHELGHFYFRNHSEKYYNYLRTIIPNYDELDRKLMRYIYA